MTITDFIKKYGFLGKTFFISQLNEIQLNELKNCNEFKNVKNFNVVNPHETFYVNNASSFINEILKSNTIFNEKINIVSISSTHIYPVYNIFNLPLGFSTIKFANHKNDTRGSVIFNFDYDTLKRKYISIDEIKTEICKTLDKTNFISIINNEDNLRYEHLIHIRCHKESCHKNIGSKVTIPVETITDDLKLF